MYQSLSGAAVVEFHSVFSQIVWAGMTDACAMGEILVEILIPLDDLNLGMEL